MVVSVEGREVLDYECDGKIIEDENEQRINL